MELIDIVIYLLIGHLTHINKIKDVKMKKSLEKKMNKKDIIINTILLIIIGLAFSMSICNYIKLCKIEKDIETLYFMQPAEE